MIGSGIKKEMMLFSRGFRLFGTIAVIIGLALSYPLMYKFMEIMAEQMSAMGQELGGEAGSQVTEAVNSMNGMIESIKAMYGGSMANVGFRTGLSSLASTGFLIVALLLMSAAGGEQKKRSVIIPNCSGLTPVGYVLPKFIIYPVLITIITFGGSMLTAGICNLIFDNPLIMQDALISSACVSVFVMFMISLYLLLGLSTGRPGISVIILFAASSLLPLLLQSMNINKYNPFALQDLLMYSYAEIDMNNFVLSVVVSVVLSVICCLLSLMVTTLRKIDNSVGEANL